MFPSRRVGAFAISCCTLVLASAVNSAVAGTAVPQYFVTDLTPLSGSANAINNRGQVVGEFITSGGSLHAFLYSGGVFTDMGTDGGAYSDASAINDAGQIAGNSGHAFVYSNGAFHDLAAPSGMGDPTLYGINNSGQIVGWSDQENVPNPFQAAVLYSGGSFHQIGTLGGSTSVANAINNSGQVVGWADTSDGNGHAFLYSDGMMTDLGTLGGDSEAHAINDSGEVVGDSVIGNDGNSNLHAFLYSNGAMSDLGVLPGKPSSMAKGINDNGQIVGESFGGPGLDSRAFLYQDGTMYDLNSLLVNQPDYVVADALGINASGQIVGIADMPNGGLNAILLTPTSVPVPPAAWAALATLPVLLCSKRLLRGVTRPFFGGSL